MSESPQGGDRPSPDVGDFSLDVNVELLPHAGRSLHGVDESKRAVG